MWRRRALGWPLILLLGGCTLVSGDRGARVPIEDRPVASASRPPLRVPEARPPEVRPAPPPIAAPLPAPEPAPVVALPLPPPVAAPSPPSVPSPQPVEVGPPPPRPVESSPPAAPQPPPPPVARLAPERGLPRGTPARSPAVAALTAQASQQANAGDLEQASASLERALRIEPDNPWLWHHLALVRLFQHQDEQAAHLAARSNALAADTGLQARNWRVIAQAKERVGEVEEAASAAARASALGTP